MENNAPKDILDVINIVLRRLLLPEDSVDVLKGLISLSVSSTTMKNIFNDAVIIGMSHRFLRVRYRYVMNKLKYYALKNDALKFLTLAKVFEELLRPHVSYPLISDLLLYVVHHSSYEFLNWYTLRQRPLSLVTFYEKSVAGQGFSGTRPKICLKAFKYAVEQGWTDKASLLMKFLLEYSGLDRWARPEQVEKIDDAIRAKKKINLELFALYLMNMCPRKPNNADPEEVVKSLIQELPWNAVKATKAMLDLPIEEQPWFHGNISRRDIINMFDCPETRNCFILSYYGTTIYLNQYDTRKEQKLTEEAKIAHLNYGLKRKGEITDLPLYYFYHALIVNDFETVKSIANEHPLDWERTMRQPHPISEYLNKADVVREDIFDWLIKRFGPVFKVKLDWERSSMPESHLAAIKRMLPFLLRISGKILYQYIETAAPYTKAEMELLVSCWDGTNSASVWYSLFGNEICKKRKLIGEAKMMTFLAWRKAEGISAGFRTLPKELIKIIIGYIDEEPVIYQLAMILVKHSTPSSIYYPMMKEWLERYDWSIRFYAAAASKMSEAASRKLQQTLLTMKSSFFKKHMTEFPPHYYCWRLLKVVIKYGNPASQDAIRIDARAKELSLFALKYKNRQSLHFLISRGVFKMPTRVEFEASLKPEKHKVTYDEATALVADIRKAVDME